MSLPRILIAGLRGGSGKTFLSVGLAAALRKRGLRVAPFKKGPDYIDASWLSMAADEPCRNLDLFLMSRQSIVRSFVASAGHADVAVIEGNRGLYDGMDAHGTYSTAELAKLLGAPVILAVNCSKSTRTVAASVLGCQRLDPQVPIRGVILNQTAGPRHESVLREAVEEICGLPVLGAMARIREQIFPERHLGLVPPQEHDQKTRAVQRVAAVAEQYLDLDTIWSLARQAPALGPHDQSLSPRDGSKPGLARVGVFRDAAFQFYYPENLEALAREGASLIEISPLRDSELPEVDALYIGGGFPETLAPALAENRLFVDSLRKGIKRGMPVYAECGGTVYLGEKLVLQENSYPMAGVLPVVFAFGKKPQGHGYTELETVADNPFFSVGDSLRGHEFHYTYVRDYTTVTGPSLKRTSGGVEKGRSSSRARAAPSGANQLDAAVISATASTSPDPPEGLTFAFHVRRGFGFDGKRDGLCWRNVLANYTHLHALGAEHWAASVVRQAVRYGARNEPNGPVAYPGHEVEIASQE